MVRCREGRQLDWHPRISAPSVCACSFISIPHSQHVGSTATLGPKQTILGAKGNEGRSAKRLWFFLAESSRKQKHSGTPNT